MLYVMSEEALLVVNTVFHKLMKTFFCYEKVMNSTVGDLCDDPVQSNSPIAVPPEVDVVNDTK